MSDLPFADRADFEDADPGANRLAVAVPGLAVARPGKEG